MINCSQKCALGMLLSVLVPSSVWAKGIDVQSMGPVFEIRLETHVSSYASKPGDIIRGVVVAPVKQHGMVVIPQGSRIYGKVVKATRVGHGLIHERAGLELEFTEWEHPNGERNPISVQLVGIDNAREQVNEKGQIKGILAAGGAPGIILGLWRFPQPGLMARTAYGFAGVSHFLLQKMPVMPLGIASVIALRFLVVRWPEPEIHFAPGTDLILSLQLRPEGPTPEKAVEYEAAPEHLEEVTALQPFRTSRSNTQTLADVVNVVFLGSRELLEEAFTHAGWNPAEQLTRGSGMRMIRAISAQKGYPTAPVSTLLLEGELPLVTFQKSLNSLSKRHHVRIWSRQEEYEGESMWLGAATHDTGIRIHSKGFTHKIDPFVDQERRKVVEDLKFAGCVESVKMVERPHVLAMFGSEAVTDGRLAVLQLKKCETPNRIEHSEYPAPPLNGSKAQKLARRFVLEGRHSVLRGNVYYWGYRLVRMAVDCVRHREGPPPTLHAFRAVD